MDNYKIHRTRGLLENIMPQAFLRLGQKENKPCSNPKCGSPAADSFNSQTRKMERGLCYDCTISELNGLVGVELASKLDDCAVNEVESKTATLSVMQKIIDESARRNASNP